MDSGFEAFYKWLMQNLRYPVELRQKNISSHMVVEFIVNSVGYIEIVDINTIKGTADKQFEDEVRRVMLSAPQWKPGVKDGKPVACRMTIPVVFGTME
jgi:TonB family protein